MPSEESKERPEAHQAPSGAMPSNQSSDLYIPRRITGHSGVGPIPEHRRERHSRTQAAVPGRAGMAGGSMARLDDIEAELKRGCFSENQPAERTIHELVKRLRAA